MDGRILGFAVGRPCALEACQTFADRQFRQLGDRVDLEFAHD